MKHYDIALTAIDAAHTAIEHLEGRNGQIDGAERLPELYIYTRERKFPPPETLARKFGELNGTPFPFLSLGKAPEQTRVFFTTFRAVAEALEPFHEYDPEGMEALAMEMAQVAQERKKETALDASTDKSPVPDPAQPADLPSVPGVENPPLNMAADAVADGKAEPKEEPDTKAGDGDMAKTSDAAPKKKNK